MRGFGRRWRFARQERSPRLQCQGSCLGQSRAAMFPWPDGRKVAEHPPWAPRQPYLPLALTLVLAVLLLSIDVMFTFWAEALMLVLP